MDRRALIALLMMPFGQSWVSSNITTRDNLTTYKLTNDWQITIPDKLTISTKDGWSKTFTHDELKRILSE